MKLFDAMGKQCPITCTDTKGNAIKITTHESALSSASASKL